MQDRMFGRLLGFALFFMAYWFFGNLYEEIVMVPNHLVNPLYRLEGYQQYFHVVNPVFYFVPFTQLAVLVTIYLFLKCKDEELRLFLRKASWYGLFAIVITMVIVTQINLKLFSPEFTKYKNDLYLLSAMWLIGNAIRLILVAMSGNYLLKAFILYRQLKRPLSTK
jgi:hypothetical protein